MEISRQFGGETAMTSPKRFPEGNAVTSSGTLCSKAQASGRPEFLADFRCGDLRKASTLEDVVREGRSLLGSEDVFWGIVK